MTEEIKPLSEKILQRIIEHASTQDVNRAMWLDHKRTLEAIDEKVREAVRLLKDIRFLREDYKQQMFMHIDKIFGEKLVK